MVREEILNKGLVRNYFKESLDSFHRVDITDTKNKDLLSYLYNTSGLTILGLLSNDTNLDKFVQFLNKYSTPIEDIPIYVVEGKVMNNIYNLQGVKKYPDDLNIVIVSLADLQNIDPELFRVRYNISNSGWFDDIVEDNKLDINYGDEIDNDSIINEDFDIKYNHK